MFEVPAIVDIPVYHKGKARASRKSFLVIFAAANRSHLILVFGLTLAVGLRESLAKLLKASFFSY